MGGGRRVCLILIGWKCLCRLCACSEAFELPEKKGMESQLGTSKKRTNIITTVSKKVLLILRLGKLMSDDVCWQ